MRILFLAPTVRVNEASGDAVHVTAELVGLSTRGHRLLAFVSESDSASDSDNTDLTNRQIELCLSGYERTFESVPDLVRYAATLVRVFSGSVRRFKSFRPQVLYERHVFIDLGPFLSKLLGVPSVVELNGLAAIERPTLDISRSAMTRLGWFLERTTLRGHTGYVCVTRQLANTVKVITNRGGSHPVLVTGNGADTEMFTPGIVSPTELGLPEGRYAVFVGHIVKWQGLEWLIEAMDEVVKREPSARLVIIGNGPDLGNLMSVTERLSLANRVFFTGGIPHSEIPMYLRIASVCLSPKVSGKERIGQLEGMSPIKVFEYMAAGRPVIITKSGELSDTIEREGLGSAVEYGDTGSLVAALVEYLGLTEKSRAAGARGRNWVTKNQSWKSIVVRIEALLMDVTEHGHEGWRGHG